MTESRTLAPAIAAVVLCACADRGVTPVRASPASVVALTTLPAQASVGTMLPPVQARVSDANGNAVGGTTYFRFGIPQNQDALIEITGFSRAPLPLAMRLTIVRIK